MASCRPCLFTLGSQIQEGRGDLKNPEPPFTFLLYLSRYFYFYGKKKWTDGRTWGQRSPHLYLSLLRALRLLSSLFGLPSPICTADGSSHLCGQAESNPVDPLVVQLLFTNIWAAPAAMRKNQSPPQPSDVMDVITSPRLAAAQHPSHIAAMFVSSRRSQHSSHQPSSSSQQSAAAHHTVAPLAAPRCSAATLAATPRYH